MISERKLKRVEILAQIDDGRLRVETGANVLAMSKRQIFRLLQKYRADGASAIRHKAPGRSPNNRIHAAKRHYVLDLIEEKYADFGPTLAAEMLAEHHGFAVSTETLRKWMIERGLWLPRTQRRRFHQPRNRRKCFGELIQIDGSDHRWFEDRNDPCTLPVFIDDATSQLMTLRFVRSESTFSYFEVLEDYLSEHGRPVGFYSNKHTVFRNARPNEHGNGMTQFGRALAELNIEILCANTSQAKGRVERANRTLQDRLVKELRLKNISDMDAGNAFLKQYRDRFNQQFTKPAAKVDNLHRAMNVEPDRLNDVLCLRDQRHVGQQLTFKCNNRKIMLEVNEMTRGLVGKYVDTFEMADGRLRCDGKGSNCPYSVFDNGSQRINQATITDNKRLGAALALIKLQQRKYAPPIVGPSSAKNGYKKRGRKRHQESLSSPMQTSED